MSSMVRYDGLQKENLIITQHGLRTSMQWSHCQAAVCCLCAHSLLQCSSHFLKALHASIRIRQTL